MHILYFSVSALFWGGSYIAIGIAVQEYPPVFAATMRVLVAFLILWAQLLLRKRKILKFPYRLQAILSGTLAMGLAWIFLFWGEQHIPPALAGILNSLAPVFTVVFAPLITPKDKLSWNKWAGVVVGSLGIFFIFGPELSGPLSPYKMGMIAVALVSLFYGIGTLWSRRILIHMPNSVYFFYHCMGALILLIVVSLFTEVGRVPIVWSLKGTVAILYLSIFSTVIALSLYLRLVHQRGAVEASSIGLIIPVIAIILDAILLKSYLSYNQVLGMMVILVAIALIQRPLHGFSFMKKRPKMPPELP